MRQQLLQQRVWRGSRPNVIWLSSERGLELLERGCCALRVLRQEARQQVLQEGQEKQVPQEGRPEEMCALLWRMHFRVKHESCRCGFAHAQVCSCTE
eukprot:3643471-Prymnesium_polylepis.1